MRRRRGSAVAGVVVVTGILVVGAIAVTYYQQANAPGRINQSDLPRIESALTTVPARDVPGRDLPGAPRPSGSVRTYFVESATVTSVVYTQHQAFADVRSELLQRIPAAGWQALGESSPTPASQSSRLWHEVYLKDRQVLQVTMYRNADVTATTYVLQGHSG